MVLEEVCQEGKRIIDTLTTKYVEQELTLPIIQLIDIICLFDLYGIPYEVFKYFF